MTWLAPTLDQRMTIPDTHRVSARDKPCKEVEQVWCVWCDMWRVRRHLPLFIELMLLLPACDDVWGC